MSIYLHMLSTVTDETGASIQDIAGIYIHEHRNKMSPVINMP